MPFISLAFKKGIGRIELKSEAFFMNKSYKLMYVPYYGSVVLEKRNISLSLELKEEKPEVEDPDQAIQKKAP
jgi:hypothetical protein